MSNSTLYPVTLYTDGGCSPNPGLGGYAAILQQGKHERVLSGAVADTTNYRMELMAVVVGLEALTKPSQVQVVSDNNNVVRGGNEWLAVWIKKGWVNSRNKPVQHRDLWERIQVAMQIHAVSFIKVKAHVALSKASDAEQMNHRADGLVTEARTHFKAGSADATESAPKSEPAQAVERLFIAGSRVAHDEMLAYARRCVARAVTLGWTIIVGDNPQGIDAVVVRELNRLKYKNVIVVGIAAQGRNGGVRGGRYIRCGKNYSERDQAMARTADRGLFIWNGNHETSPGTLAGASYMKDLSDKVVHLVDHHLQSA